MPSSDQIRRSLSDGANKKADADRRVSEALAVQARKAVVLIDPAPQRGHVIWPGA